MALFEFLGDFFCIPKLCRQFWVIKHVSRVLKIYFYIFSLFLPILFLFLFSVVFLFFQRALPSFLLFPGASSAHCLGLPLLGLKPSPAKGYGAPSRPLDPIHGHDRSSVGRSPFSSAVRRGRRERRSPAPFALRRRPSCRPASPIRAAHLGFPSPFPFFLCRRLRSKSAPLFRHGSR